MNIHSRTYFQDLSVSDVQQLSALRTLIRGDLYANHALAPHTAWRAGGAAQYFYRPTDLPDLIFFLKHLPNSIPITWLGAATNVLVRDAGLSGVVICLRGCVNELYWIDAAVSAQAEQIWQKEQAEQLDHIGHIEQLKQEVEVTERTKKTEKAKSIEESKGAEKVEGIGGTEEIPQLQQFTLLHVEAGVYCSRLVQFLTRCGICDLTFLAGIPGTIGGALAMNAGAYGGELWQHVANVTTTDRYGNIRRRACCEFQAGYREVKGLRDDEWFVACDLRLPGLQGSSEHNIACARQRVRDLLLKRAASQPLHTFNCGSVFRNPPGDYAARLIEQSGLKGARIGGAVVSTKHANFIINENGVATATDIESLVKHVAYIVERDSGVLLQTEVKILGAQQL